jgi:hypothetical protein
MLCAGVEGSCLHRPENWLMRQLNNEPKLVYKVGLIRGNQSFRFYMSSWRPKGGCREGIPVDVSNVKWEVPIM